MCAHYAREGAIAQRVSQSVPFGVWMLHLEQGHVYVILRSKIHLWRWSDVSEVWSAIFLAICELLVHHRCDAGSKATSKWRGFGGKFTDTARVNHKLSRINQSIREIDEWLEASAFAFSIELLSLQQKEFATANCTCTYVCVWYAGPLHTRTRVCRLKHVCHVLRHLQ